MTQPRRDERHAPAMDCTISSPIGLPSSALSRRLHLALIFQPCTLALKQAFVFRALDSIALQPCVFKLRTAASPRADAASRSASVSTSQPLSFWPKTTIQHATDKAIDSRQLRLRESLLDHRWDDHAKLGALAYPLPSAQCANSRPRFLFWSGHIRPHRRRGQEHSSLQLGIEATCCAEVLCAWI